MPTWCASGDRHSLLQLTVSRNSWPTSSAGERRWPPSTKFSCGPTRARHKHPPAPSRQTCQRRPSHLSCSDNRPPNTIWRDFVQRCGVVPSGFNCWTLIRRTKETQETNWGCNFQWHNSFSCSTSERQSFCTEGNSEEPDCDYHCWTLFIQGRMLSSS